MAGGGVLFLAVARQSERHDVRDAALDDVHVFGVKCRRSASLRRPQVGEQRRHALLLLVILETADEGFRARQ